MPPTPSPRRKPGSRKVRKDWIPAVRQAHGPEPIEGLSPERRLRRYFLYDRKLLSDLSRCGWPPARLRLGEESLKVFFKHLFRTMMEFPGPLSPFRASVTFWDCTLTHNTWHCNPPDFTRKVISGSLNLPLSISICRSHEGVQEFGELVLNPDPIV